MLVKKHLVRRSIVNQARKLFDCKLELSEYAIRVSLWSLFRRYHIRNLLRNGRN